MFPWKENVEARTNTAARTRPSDIAVVLQDSVALRPSSVPEHGKHNYYFKSDEDFRVDCYC
jgi:hypothetical protein